MTIRRGIGWLIALAIALAVGAWSYSIANATRAPSRALVVGGPMSGTAQASLAYNLYALRSAERPDATVQRGEAQLARTAYRAEPLSVPALGILAMSMTGGERAQDRQALLDLAGKITRRNVLITNELIKSAALRSDDRAFFSWLSRVMLVGKEAKSAYGSAMAAATARDGAVEALTPVIGPRPRWADYYWQLVVKQPESLVNAARLRLAVLEAPWRQREVMPADKQLLLALTRHGHFELARDLAVGLGLPRPAGANLLSNGDFGAVPELAPFDWRLSSQGTLGASIDPQSKNLLISAIGGARGAAAQQLLYLVPGNYSLDWKLTASGPVSPQALQVRLTCAQRGSGEIALPPISLVPNEGQAALSVPASGCQWYWFAVVVEIPDASLGLDINVQQLSLQSRVTGQPGQ